MRFLMFPYTLSHSCGSVPKPETLSILRLILPGSPTPWTVNIEDAAPPTGWSPMAARVGDCQEFFTSPVESYRQGFPFAPMELEIVRWTW